MPFFTYAKSSFPMTWFILSLKFELTVGVLNLKLENKKDKIRFTLPFRLSYPLD